LRVGLAPSPLREKVRMRGILVVLIYEHLAGMTDRKDRNEAGRAQGALLQRHVLRASEERVAAQVPMRATVRFH